MIFIPAIRIGSGTPCVEKTGEGTLYTTGFEIEVKTSYAAATREFGEGFPWLLDDALLGTSTSDLKNGFKSARIRDGKVEMQWDATQGIKRFSFLAARSNFSGDRTGISPILSVQKSVDQGTTWTTVGTVDLAGINVLTSYSFDVNEDSPCRMRINKTGGDAGKRCNVDDVQIVEKRYGCDEIPCEPDEPCVDGEKDYNTTWYLKIHDGITGATGVLNSWSLKFFDGTVYSVSPNAAINDGQTTTSTLVVSGQPLDVKTSEILFSCNISHTNKSNLWVTLSPSSSTWTQGQAFPPLGSEMILISGYEGGSAQDIVITEQPLSSFNGTLYDPLPITSESGLPVFDENGVLICGPAPDVEYGRLAAYFNTLPRTTLSSGNNWTVQWGHYQGAGITLCNSCTQLDSAVSIHANTDRYLYIFVWPRSLTNPAGPVYITIAGTTILGIPGRAYYIPCPYTYTGPVVTEGFGYPLLSDLTPWTVEAVYKRGAVGCILDARVVGYSA